MACGCVLLVAQKFKLLCRFQGEGQREAVVVLGTVLHLLLAACFSNLSGLVQVGALVAVLVAIPLFPEWPNRLLDACEAEAGASSGRTSGTGVSAASAAPPVTPAAAGAARPAAPPGAPARRAPLPWGMLVAFLLMAFSVNLVRSEIDFGLADSSIDQAQMVSLATLLFVAAASAAFLLRYRLNVRATSFMVVAMAAFSIIFLFGWDGAPLMASAFSAAAFYLLVALVWETTSTYGRTLPGREVWFGAVSHLVYHLGYCLGTLSFWLLGASSAGSDAALVLFSSYAALTGAFFLYEKSSAGYAPALSKRASDPGVDGLRAALWEVCYRLAQGACLTQREYEVLCSFATGKSVRAVAEELSVSENTVKSHVTHIYAKLGVHSREELMALVYEGRAS